jgi:hypothetical protein
MTPIEAKAAQLRAQGVPFPPFVLPLPLPGGGQMFAIPGIAVAIFQAPGSGQAFAVQGDILSRYAMGTGAIPLDLTSGGGPLSPLGYPVSDETDWVAPGYRQSAFENGHITWIPGKGARIHAGDDGKLSYALANVAAHAAMLLDLKRDDAKARILREEPTGGGEWCGFTLANLFKAAGMDPQLTGQFANTGSLTEFGSYYQEDILRNPIRPQWIARTGDGQDLREWHAQNNASRRITWWDELQGDATPDIMPGDIVLFDHKAGAGADHIQVVLDWYPEGRVATVVDGNGLGFVKRTTRQAEVGGRPLVPGDYIQASPAVSATQPVSKAEKQALLAQLEHFDVVLPGGEGGYVGVSCHRLTAAGQRNPPAGNSEGPHSRVTAIVRASRLDFERHSYSGLSRG